MERLGGLSALPVAYKGCVLGLQRLHASVFSSIKAEIKIPNQSVLLCGPNAIKWKCFEESKNVINQWGLLSWLGFYFLTM